MRSSHSAMLKETCAVALDLEHGAKLPDRGRAVVGGGEGDALLKLLPRAVELVLRLGGGG